MSFFDNQRSEFLTWMRSSVISFWSHLWRQSSSRRVPSHKCDQLLLRTIPRDDSKREAMTRSWWMTSTRRCLPLLLHSICIQLEKRKLSKTEGHPQVKADQKSDIMKERQIPYQKNDSSVRVG